MRIIYLPAVEKHIPLGVYIKGIKKAKSHLDEEFPHGLTTSGRDIIQQFVSGLMERINDAIPYKCRKNSF